MSQVLNKHDHMTTSFSGNDSGSSNGSGNGSSNPSIIATNQEEHLKSWSNYISEHYDTMSALKIVVDGQRIFCGDKCLDLTKKVKMLALFKVFVTAPNYRLSKEKLVEKIYLRAIDHQPSMRQQICLEHNIVKLLSRARKIAQSALIFSHQKHMSLDWFVYDPYEKAYQLFRLRNKKLWF
jgi:hypothetical protein